VLGLVVAGTLKPAQTGWFEFGPRL